MMAEAELERFRREWQEEVRTRDRHTLGTQGSQPSDSQPSTSRQVPQKPLIAQRKAVEDDQLGGGWNFDDLEEREHNRQLGVSGEGVHPEAVQHQEPSTALEFYEKAVESETQGKLGESVAHYRKAFKLNDHVDQQYKNKHFPPTTFAAQSKASKNAPSTASPTFPDPAHTSLRSGSTSSAAIPDLVAGFANEAIKGAAPIIERDILPPCPIACTPSELLTEILRFSALDDVASFAHLGGVCKRLAYLVATESRVWKELCLGSKFGFSSMHFEFACTIDGHLIESHTLEDFDDLTIADEPSDGTSIAKENPHKLDLLALSPAYPSYAAMFHHRPRLRFAGVYISTVNYVRPGASQPSQLSWNSPVHIVTYYRYLRFYRDGSCVSLLTTVEPMEVVPHFDTKRIGETPGAVASPGLAAVARYTLRGRWRMSPLHPPEGSEKVSEADEEEREPEGNVLVETYGPVPPLVYHLQLALRSNSGKGSKNTKLMWRSFWSYNHITDDWAEFQLRNDRPYVWSRVKSWSEA